MNEIYFKSLYLLKNYLSEYKKIPSERTWNRFAVKNDCLSSKTIQYLYGIKFNNLCRKLIKKNK